ncbi:unnamed protein product [Phytomonas sp. EM1]|nr:unnamed protein product [Phytomonas sp. EM1]|eukprot:CCW63169.1 unnamed protein product [Phytomonas sp. isolate EM1]
MSPEKDDFDDKDSDLATRQRSKGLEQKLPAMIGRHIVLGHVLGSGGFGKVYFACDRKNNMNVAVKIIDKAIVKRQGTQEYVEREIEMMRKINNKHIVKLLDAIETSNAYNLVMELAPNGELFDKIVDSERFDENVARKYFQQLICAVHYCHGMHIAHRDLKAENLLLGEGNVLKVCDFGLSRYTTEGVFNDNAVMLTSLAGSLDYQAPEMLKERGYEGCACDMWSCGCILFFMLCSYLPFTDRSDGLTRKRILSGQYNRRNRFLSEGAAVLIEHLLERDPARRYTTQDVIRNEWFAQDLDPRLFPDAGLGEVGAPGSPPPSGEGWQPRVPFSPDAAGSPESPSMSPTSEKAMELHQAFLSCNVTKDGFLSKEQVRDALIKLNGEKPVSEEKVRDFMSYFNLDKEGRITEEDFVVGWTQHQNQLGKKYDLAKMVNLFHYDLEKEFLEEIRKAFDSIDTQNSGLITRKNLTALGIDFTEEEIKTLLESIDPDHKGKRHITFERFVGMCLRYDLLKNHPLAVRLRHLDNLFDFTEHQSFKTYLNTGYTVAGPRAVIKVQLLAKQESLATKFEEGDAYGFLYGTHTIGGRKVLEVGVRLLPVVEGYTKVLVYRIRGKTKDFHRWFLNLRKAMKDELLRCEEDTAVEGEPELM